jgi:UDP-2,3-diacylglucosamine pyrophosphatase LpxH
MYVIRGNHDNPDWFDGALKFSNLILLRDYSVVDIDGYKVLFVGGGISIDRLPRLAQYMSGANRQTWWHDETFPLEEDKLIQYENIDMVVTHSAPDFIFPYGVDAPIVNEFAHQDKNLKRDLRGERADLTRMYEILKMKNTIKHWVYGHFHTSSDLEYEHTRFRLLNIGEFYELK